jgi:phage terminase large subunit-like protein
MPAREMTWISNPRAGSKICVGFDGSESNDWTAIRAQTKDGLNFTPRYGPERALRPTIWNPDEFGGRIPRDQVHIAVAHIFARWDVSRMYCDPQDWHSEIGDWSVRYGEERVVEWATNRPKQMCEALQRFETDLRTGRTTHDGCPITTTHVLNARKVPQANQRFILGKPVGEYHRKIDASMAAVLASEAAADANLAGWESQPSGISTAMYGFN